MDGGELRGGEVGWEEELRCCIRQKAEDPEHPGEEGGCLLPPTPHHWNGSSLCLSQHPGGGRTASGPNISLLPARFAGACGPLG